MNYSKKNFVFYVSIIFCPWLQGSVENNINFVYTAALLNGGIAAVQNAPYGFNTTGGMPVKSPLSGYQLPDSLTLSTCNADGYSLFYIPFKNKESPFIEMGFKYSEIRDMPSQYMFTHSKGHLFKASRNGFFILKFLLTDFAYTGIKKKPFMIAPSPKKNEYQYVIDKETRESLIKELATIKDDNKNMSQ